ncbi:PREDICTED: serine/threonine-protein phosphatase 7 long form homolog [Erythranthe guttata]|uniref:serine/threonine-protein phosphatase 7 long form homolog n=1 Tax=Erythranthe guttata TaxID=4155 RepID=UPI00064DEC15|nr:PREDICTED: serine/threonine-protein phosphatase 7 long form homolog [Erythranthe guttata]|eukprot:XP_012856099.1 PREDICTED: serine/threonine-protein phosphatase 7 long form homolog [Erythranthe guttata]
MEGELASHQPYLVVGSTADLAAPVEPQPPRVPPTVSNRKRKENARKSKVEKPKKRCTPFNPPGRRTRTDEGASSATTTTAPALALSAPPASTMEVGASCSQPNASQGPEIADLIPNFKDHISYRILSGDEREDFRTHNHTKKLVTWVCAPFISEAVSRVGLMPLVTSSYNAIDSYLLRAFVERWHPTTCTFHLPVRKMTITLNDVSTLIGLPVVGRAVASNRLRQSNTWGKTYVAKMLGVYPDSEAMGAGERTLKLGWLHRTFGKITARDCEMKKLYATRAYLLYLLGCTIFVDKTGSLVSIEWLQFLENVDTIGEYAWGTACLCFLYRALSKASKATTAQLNGYLTLFQAWIYEHFPSFNPTFRPQFEGYLANRWVYPKNSTTSVERARHLRLMLDELKPDEVIWDPYFELRDRFPMPESAWFSGMLCCLDFLQPHHPDRVLRQFSRVQQLYQLS